MDQGAWERSLRPRACLKLRSAGALAVMGAGFDDADGADPFADLDDYCDEAPVVKRSALSPCAAFKGASGGFTSPGERERESAREREGERERARTRETERERERQKRRGLCAEPASL